MQYGLLSAAVGQRPRNYSSCCCWIFLLIYALSTSTTMLPPFFKYCKLSLYLSIYHSTLYLSINPSSSIFICQSINRPLPFPKNQYIIAADQGAGIGLVYYQTFLVRTFYVESPVCGNLTKIVRCKLSNSHKM